MQVDEDNVPILKGRSLRPKDAATVLVKQSLQLNRIDTRYRNVRTNPEHDERAQQEPETVPRETARRALRRFRCCRHVCLI